MFGERVEWQADSPTAKLKLTVFLLTLEREGEREERTDERSRADEGGGCLTADFGVSTAENMNPATQNDAQIAFRVPFYSSESRFHIPSQRKKMKKKKQLLECH